MPETRLSEEHCFEWLRGLRWPSGIVCPRCGSRRITTHSKFTRTPRRRYLCLGCRRTFTDLTGTPLTRTNLPLSSWFLYVRFRREGCSVSELANALGVKWDTVAHMGRRLSGAPEWTARLSEAMTRLRRDA